MSTLSQNIFKFYTTLSIPLLYLVVLYTIASTPNSFSFSLELLKNIYTRAFFTSMAWLGVCLWISSYYYLGHGFTVLPKIPQKKVATGPYKYLKHPMYTAIFLTFSGLSLAILSWPGFLINLLVLTPINIYRANKENQILTTLIDDK